MVFYTFFYALTIAFLLTLLITGLTKNKGPWNNFWALFLVLGLIIWVASLWITPIGPMWNGIAWADLLVIGILITLLLAATSEAKKHSSEYRTREGEVDLVAESKKDTTAITLFGVFFWLFVATLVVLLVVGLTNYF
jgi:hypothetical protein